MRLRLPLLAFLLVAPPLTATTFERVTTAELTRRAERVCVVRCDSCRAERDRRSGLVYTVVRLRLVEDIKGRSAGSTIELRLVGGEADGVRTVVVGMPRFRAGEESILLLGKRNRAGFPTVVAARRGMLRLGRDKQGARYLRDAVTGFEDLKTAKAKRIGLDSFRAACKKEQKRVKADDKKVAPK